MSPVLLGALAAAAGAAGGLLVVTRWWALRRPRLADRVAPYLRDVAQPSRLLAAPLPIGSGLSGAAQQALHAAGGRLDRLLGGSASVRRRLDRAGGDVTLEEFRVSQVVWAVAGAAAGVGLALLLAAAQGPPPVVASVVIVVSGAVTGLLLRDQTLSRRIARREERMLAEFPTVAELLALAVTAGEGPTAALDRVASRGQGELAHELGRVLADVRSGSGLVPALDRLADGTGLGPVRRFVDGVAVAVERGTPLADVLRAQAMDARSAARRRLVETAARREVAMMVPVVFLILPISVVFALFPGFYGLSLSTP